MKQFGKKKEGEMKKTYIISAIIGLMIALPALAVSVCTKDSIVSVVLDPDVGGSSYTYNNATGVWKTVFSYGNVSGISTCSASKPSGGMGAIRTVDGEYLDAAGGAVSGQYCWCKMTHPMSSLWAFAYDYGSASGCASGCTYGCGNRVQNDVALRAGLFGSVALASDAY